MADSWNLGIDDFAKLETFLNKQVIIKLDKDEYKEGLLLSVDDEGEARLMDDNGIIWFGWPTLEVQLREQVS